MQLHQEVEKNKKIQVNSIWLYQIFFFFFLSPLLSFSLFLFPFLISPNCLGVLILSDHILFKLRKKPYDWGKYQKSNQGIVNNNHVTQAINHLGLSIFLHLGLKFPVPLICYLPMEVKMSPSQQIFQKWMDPHCQGSWEAAC